ncbi:MAG: Hpt domain-containing protein [Bryobacterales bacterium]|nr:Hpt domain-containing protein [Bryobacterales bacterium]
MSFSNQIAVLDRAVALERVGGDSELLQEMAQLFLDEYPSQLDAVRVAVLARDAKALERSAHSLKGSVGNFGAAAAQDAALRLEMIGRRGELQDVEQEFRNLEAALSALQPEMESLAQSNW